MNLIALIFALVAFILSACEVKLAGTNMLPVGCAFLTVAFMLPGGWPAWWARPPG